MGNRPLFVIGFPRSGTTLLQTMLGAHPRIAAPPEMHFIWRIAGLADYYGDLGDDASLRRALHDTIAPPTRGFAECGWDEERLFSRLVEGPRSYAALLDGVLSDFANRRGKARWCEKTPGQWASSALELFPNAQIIHIVRDPRAVVASGVTAPYETRRPETLARDWRKFTLDNIQFGSRVGPSTYLQVRYEDLVADPTSVLRLVCTFLEETFAPEMVDPSQRQRESTSAVMGTWQADALQPVRAASLDGWTQRLNRWQRARIAAVVFDLLAPLGYALPGKRSVSLGRVLDAFDVITRVRERRTTGDRSRVTDPAERHRGVQRQIAETARRVWGDVPTEAGFTEETQAFGGTIAR